MRAASSITNWDESANSSHFILLHNGASVIINYIRNVDGKGLRKGVDTVENTV
jgi:hypothetical protein